MKQRLQRLVVLGLAVATVAGSSVPVYAAEIVPNANVEATAEVPTTDEEVTPEDEQKPEGENGEENPNEDADAPTIQATATWNGSGDVVLKFNPNGLKEGSYLWSEGGLYPTETELGDAVDVEDPIIDFEAGTITITEANLKGMIKYLEERWSEDEDFHFTSGTGVLIFYFDAGNDESWELRTDIKMSVKDAGITDPEQKPDDNEAEGNITIPSTWDGDLELKVDGVDLSKVELVYFHGIFAEGVPYDAGIRIGKENINVEKSTIVFPESILADAIKRQNEKLEALGMDKLGATTEFIIDDVYAALEDGTVVFFKDVAGKSLQCKNPLYESEQKPDPEQKPEVKPETKPQTNNTTTAPKTGDVANVTGLMGTCAGSLGVALMAFKRRFRK